MRKAFAKVFLTLALLTGLGTALSACHTVECAGQDITDTGRAVQHL